MSRDYQEISGVCPDPGAAMYVSLKIAGNGAKTKYYFVRARSRNDALVFCAYTRLTAS